jgi:DNA adenine methylase
LMQYFGGKALVGARIAEACGKRRTPGSLFVDMFCGSLNVIRYVPSKLPLAAGGLVESPRLAVDACAPLITMWRAAFAGWVPPEVVTKEDYERIKQMKDPNEPLTAFVLFGCSFGGKWCGGYAKNRPTQRYAEHASKVVVKKAADCRGVALECCDYQEKEPGCWPFGTVMYCDPPYAGTVGYAAVGPFDTDAFWKWAGAHARRGVHVYVSESGSCEEPLGWSLELEQTASQAGRLTPGKVARVDRLFYCGPSSSRWSRPRLRAS